MARSICRVLLVVVGCSFADADSFSVYSDPVQLRYGEVYQTVQYSPRLRLPNEVVERYADGRKAMAITNFTLDMLRKSVDGSETPVSLHDHYVHHYILYFGSHRSLGNLAKAASEDTHLKHMLTSCHGMNGGGLRHWQRHMEATGAPPEEYESASFGSAAGAEFRHNPQVFQSPFRFVLHKPEMWMPVFHVINTQNDTRPVSPLLECPCTPQRNIDRENGLIDGKKPVPSFGCSPAFAAAGNPSCNLTTYVGGWRCCEHGVFLIDTAKECESPQCTEKPKDSIFFKFTFNYEDAGLETRPLHGSSCCDATGTVHDEGNIEHDVPQCPLGTQPEKCIYVVEAVQDIAWSTKPYHKADDLVDLVFTAPHLHWAGLSIELIDTETNKTLCEVHRSPNNDHGVMYGTGSAPGNEKNYLVGLRPCSWNGQNAPRFRRDHKLLTRSVYNASMYHTGVMSLWLTSVSDVPKSALEFLV